jgi:hypothetical protein
VYVDVGKSLGVTEGDLFSIFKVSKRIKHPVTKKVVGYKILNLGELKIIDARENSSEAQIVNAYMEIQNDDLIRPYTAPFQKEIQVTKSAIELEGYIVEPKSDSEAFANGEIVYIDRGREHGLEQGNILTIYIPGEEIYKETLRRDRMGFPEKVIGKMIVLDPKSETSVALITESARELEIGMRFRLER